MERISGENRPYFDLAREWCDKLIAYQITELQDPNFYGGILCPACSLIHGRIADTVYPFAAMYDYTGEEKYLAAAHRVVAWAEYNVRRLDGSYFNDKTNSWTGTTVFASLAFGEALLYHGNCLDRATHAAWWEIYIRLSDYVYHHFRRGGHVANINYHASTAAAMALAYKLTGEEKYRTRAYESAEYCADFLDEQDLLFGESKPLPTDIQTEKGCRGIDIGYNVEESLPALVLFAHYMGDAVWYEKAKSVFTRHLDFMFPDGGWDNSFGIRANKWTYWGSRTSDGCQAGLAILAKDDPRCAEAAERNFRMLRRCTKNGLLYGGYMHIACGEEACTHHSFCHAKGLCAMIDHGFVYRSPACLPQDESYALKTYPSLQVGLVSYGDFRASVSYGDLVAHPGAAAVGGSTTLLWHRVYGPIFAAGMAKYGMSEPKNMQLARWTDEMPCPTPRISCGEYESVNAKHAVCTTEVGAGCTVFRIHGNLADVTYNEAGTYSLTYRFTKDGLTLTATSQNGGVLWLPVICESGDAVTRSGDTAFVSTARGAIALCATAPIAPAADMPARHFNVIGGCMTVPLCTVLMPNTPLAVEITYIP